jgi:hypothetical protein
VVSKLKPFGIFKLLIPSPLLLLLIVTVFSLLQELTKNNEEETIKSNKFFLEKVLMFLFDKSIYNL